MTKEFQDENDEFTATPEEEAGFLGTDEKKDEEKQEEEKKEEPEKEDEGEPEEKESEDEKGEKDEKKPESEESEEETAEQKALKRAEKFKESEKKQIEEKQDEKQEPVKSSITKEQIKEYLDVVTDEDLPGEIIIGNETVDLKSLKDQYPDDYNAIKVMSGIIADKMVRKALDEGEFVKASDVEEKLQHVDYHLSRFEFWNGLRDIHPDAKKIADSADFKEWRDKQPKHMQALSGSWDVEDAAALISAYKEHQAKTKVKEHDDKKREDKKKKDGLLSGGMRSKPDTSKKTQQQSDMDDEEAGFNEGLESRSKK